MVSDSHNSEEEDNSAEGQSICIDALSFVLGWTPDLWDVLVAGGESERSFSVKILILLVFLLDLADALIDALLAFRVISHGSSPKIKGLGGLLLAGIIIGRFIVGIYGKAIKLLKTYDEKYDENQGWDPDLPDDDVDGKISYSQLFYLKELALFFVQDGASVVLLLNSPEDKNYDWVKLTSIWLTVICGLSLVIATCRLAKKASFLLYIIPIELLHTQFIEALALGLIVWFAVINPVLASAGVMLFALYGVSDVEDIGDGIPLTDPLKHLLYFFLASGALAGMCLSFVASIQVMHGAGTDWKRYVFGQKLASAFGSKKQDTPEDDGQRSLEMSL